MGQDPPNPIPLGKTTEAHVYGKGDSSIVFLSNWDTKNDDTVTYNGQTYTLPAWSVC
jgi:hypothetical protein